MNRIGKRKPNTAKQAMIVAVVILGISAWYAHLGWQARDSARATLDRNEMVLRAMMEWDGCPEYKGDDDDKTD